MHNPDSTTININLKSDGGIESQNYDQVVNCPRPWPWPSPYPFPFPFPYPNGPFNPIQNPMGSGNGMDEEYLLFKGVRMALSFEINEEYNTKAMKEHVKEDVLPKVRSAQSIEEIDAAMEKVYVAYPNIKEFVHSTSKLYGGNDIDESDLKKRKLPKWLKFIIKVVIYILTLLIED